jgi:hypothetical protein
VENECQGTPGRPGGGVWAPRRVKFGDHRQPDVPSCCTPRAVLNLCPPCLTWSAHTSHAHTSHCPAHSSSHAPPVSGLTYHQATPFPGLDLPHTGTQLCLWPTELAPPFIMVG